VKKLVFFIVILLVLAGGSYSLYKRYVVSSDSSRDKIPFTKVQKGPFSVSVSSIGILDAAVKKNVTAGFSGKIVKIITEGTFVNKDDSVIWMDTSDYEDDMKELEVEVELAKANLLQKEESLRLTISKQKLSMESEEAKVEFQDLKLKDSRNNYENQKILVEKNLVAKSAEDSARISLLQSELSFKQAKISLKKLKEDQVSDIKIKQSDVDKSKVDLERQENKLEEVQDKIEKAVLKAAGKGNVTYSVIWKGGKMGKIAEGDQIWRRATLMEIPDPATMQTLIPISEIDVGKIEIGQLAEITVDAIPGESFPGKVDFKGVVPISESRSFFRGGSSSGPKGKEFEVRVKLDEPDERFRQGMTARARIFIKQIDETIYASQESVFGKGSNRHVFVKKNSSYEEVLVECGASNDNYIVLKKGCSAGDFLLLRDPSKKIEKIGALEGMKKKSKSMMGPGK
jgi:HlyD family secretion protein